MPLRAIAYRSDAADGVSVDRLNALVRDASHHNRLAGVTGVLLFDGSRFLQYIEGPEDGIDFVYSRLINAKSHKNVAELARGHGGVRRFPYWSMHWIPVEQHKLHAVAVADWTLMEKHRSEADVVVPAVAQLCELVQPHVQALTERG